MKKTKLLTLIGSATILLPTTLVVSCSTSSANNDIEVLPPIVVVPSIVTFQTEEGFTVKTNNDGKTATIIDSGVFNDSNLTIKNSYMHNNNEYIITSIGDNAFHNNFLSSLDLSKNTSLTNIGDYAFHNSSLTSLDLSKNTALTNIGAFAFWNSTLTSIDLSNNTSLTTIGNSVFENSVLTSLDLSNNISLTSIGNKAFWKSTLTSLDLSNNTALTTIGIAAFIKSVQIKTLKIPNSVNKIEDSAFNISISRSDLQIPSKFDTPSELARIGITII